MTGDYMAISPDADQVARPGRRLAVERADGETMIRVREEQTLPERVHLPGANRVSVIEEILLTVVEQRWLYERLGELLAAQPDEAT